MNRLRPLLLSRQEGQAVDEAVKVLSKLDNVAAFLQKKNLIMARIRVPFPTVIDHIPQARVQLSLDANIVEFVA